MEFVKPTQIRIQFFKTIQLTKVIYENKLQNKFKSEKTKINEYNDKMNLNLNNYIFFYYLQDIKYKEAINHYKTEIFSKEEKINDITKILLLFFPHLLKSNYINLTRAQSNLDYFNHTKLIFEDKSQNELENLIINFFENYKELENKKFHFHRREMCNYLESFLNMYVEKEKELIIEEDRKELFLYHHFRPFIRPEEYFTISSIEKIEDKKLI